jgi:nitroreductase
MSFTSAARALAEAVRSRRSCRAFTSRAVDIALVRELLETARYAPSGGNLQPWIVHVLSGESMSRFRSVMEPRTLASPLGGEAEYHVYPPALKDPYRSRRFKVGEDMYGHIGVRREDKAARIRQFSRNFDFFGAPVGLFFLVDRSMGPPQWSDLGMFIQTFMLLAQAQGLDTCPQEAWASWHAVVTEFIGSPAELMLFCGLALGYGDPAAPINRLRSDRVAVTDFASFHE